MPTKQIELTIEAGGVGQDYWRDLWRYRELLFVLAWRDIAVRYKQTVIGVAWALARPFLTMVVFTLVFSNLAKMPTDGAAPYALMVFAGLLPWQFFAASVADSSSSLVSNSSLISKVYFPRLILPAAAITVAFVDLMLSFAILVIMMAWYGFWPDWRIVTLPLFIAMAFLASLGAGLWIASLNVRYRDFRYIVPFLVQFGLYISPVGFSSSVVPESWRLWYSLNPMVGVIEGFRWALLGGEARIYLPGFVLSWMVIVFFLWLGVRQFRRTEKVFADVI